MRDIGLCIPVKYFSSLKIDQPFKENSRFPVIKIEIKNHITQSREPIAK
jgi:hypothetical protein